MTCPSCRTENVPGAAVCAGCGLQLFPAGEPSKGMAITAMVLGIVSFPLACAFGVGVLTGLIGLILGIVALVRANRQPEQYGGKGMAIAGVVTSGVALLVLPLIVAAIAIPSLLRARVAANESAALGDVRTVISSEITYATVNGGYYDTLACLANAQTCVPDLPAGTPAFLRDSQLASLPVKNGYKRELHLGAPAPSEMAGRVSPSSAVGFAYVVVPSQPGRSGIRAFCGNEEGIIRVAPTGEMPPIVDGKCPDSLDTL